MLANRVANIRVIRYSHARECEVRITRRGKVMCLGFPDYDRALKWARLECRSYGATGVTVQRVSKLEEGGIERGAGDISSTSNDRETLADGAI
jgi:hypothetical protein